MGDQKSRRQPDRQQIFQEPTWRLTGSTANTHRTTCRLEAAPARYAAAPPSTVPCPCALLACRLAIPRTPPPDSNAVSAPRNARTTNNSVIESKAP